nr:unnamed protein product [Callosobruchus analis]
MAGPSELVNMLNISTFPYGLPVKQESDSGTILVPKRERKGEGKGGKAKKWEMKKRKENGKRSGGKKEEKTNRDRMFYWIYPVSGNVGTANLTAQQRQDNNNNLLTDKLEELDIWRAHALFGIFTSHFPESLLG